MTYDHARDRVVLFGGWDNATILGDTWEFDGTTWVNVTPAVSPPARRYHSLCYDSGRGRVILFGGSDLAAILTDTWEFDGTSWQQSTAAGPSPARQHSPIAYDPVRRRTVLFGGDVISGFQLADTWEYDGAQWTLAAVPIGMPLRARHTLVFDDSRGQVVMFGGAVQGFPLDDTWTFDGANWTQVVGPGPSARSLATMVYDRIHGRSVLFGGIGPFLSNGHGGGGSSTIVNDTWTFDGAWFMTNAQFAPGSPAARFSSAAAGDGKRGRMIMFGGGTQTALFGDTWEWRPPSAPSFVRYGLGCVGSNGTPRLNAAPGSLPQLGTVLALQLDSLPTAPGVAVLAFGFDLVHTNGVLLPINPLPTRPSCLLWLDGDPSLIFVVTYSGTSSGFTIPVPGDPSLAGLVVGSQALVLDAGVAEGFAFTNGAILRLQ